MRTQRCAAELKDHFTTVFFSQQNYPALTVINNQEIVIKLVFTENTQKNMMTKERVLQTDPSHFKECERCSRLCTHSKINI